MVQNASGCPLTGAQGAKRDNAGGQQRATSRQRDRRGRVVGEVVKHRVGVHAGHFDRQQVNPGETCELPKSGVIEINHRLGDLGRAAVAGEGNRVTRITMEDADTQEIERPARGQLVSD